MPDSNEAVDLFAGLLVRDLSRSTQWYTRLLGTGPSFRPDDTEAVWSLGEHRFVYLKTGQGTPGSSLVSILVPDLDAFLEAAGGRGVRHDDLEDYGGGVRKAVFRDPDGNEFGVGVVPPDVR